MEFYEKFDMEAIKVDLQKKLKIMDWDIFIEVVSGYGMYRDVGEECTTFGLCEKWRRNKEAYIYINKDARNESNFLETFIHELVHVATDDFFRAAGELAELIKDEDIRQMQRDHLTMEYERQTESLAKSFEMCLGKDYLEQFIKEDINGKDKESLRRKGSKDPLH